MRLIKHKVLMLLSLMALVMGVFTFNVYAGTGEAGGDENLIVTAAWVDGELLRINVTDINGNTSSLALRLTDYLNAAENKEYISIQAVDLAGNTSGIIRLRNPFFDPTAAPVVIVTTPPNTNTTQTVIPEVNQPSGNPLTPDGTGTVIDNANSNDGIEFFTIGSEDGNVFYLIIDRQRSTNNVYFLNAVTEEDLISLARQGGREVAPAGSNNNVSAIPTPEVPDTSDTSAQQPPTTTEPPGPNEPAAGAPATDPPTTSSANSNATMYAIIAIAVLGVGGAGYYFKIVKGKRNAAYDDDEDDDYGYEDDEPDDGYDDMEDGDER